VLIEEPDRVAAFSYWCLLDDSGYEVSWCPGPSGFPKHTCALVESGQCQLVSDADVVVSSLDTRRPSSAEVLHALKHVCPDKPTVVQASERSTSPAEGWRDISEGPESAESLGDSIRNALASREVPPESPAI
jgi:hypothetical protein